MTPAFLIGVVVALISCAGPAEQAEPQQSGPQQSEQPGASSGAPQPEPRGGATRLEIDPAASEVAFHMKTTWHGVVGRTKKVSGAVTSESGDIFRDGAVTFEVDAAALDTGNSRRDRTMREAHLETGKYPKISFVSTSPPSVVSGAKEPGGSSGEASVRLAGDLTIHGVTRGVTLALKARRQGSSWIVTGELPVRLSEYRIPDPSFALNRVQDQVVVTFTVRAK